LKLAIITVDYIDDIPSPALDTSPTTSTPKCMAYSIHNLPNKLMCFLRDVQAFWVVFNDPATLEYARRKCKEITKYFPDAKVVLIENKHRPQLVTSDELKTLAKEKGWTLLHLSAGAPSGTNIVEEQIHDFILQ